MLIIAHRGYHRDVPENTLAAFNAAVGMGVDGIETDIRLSADLHPILFHDRLAPDGRAVANVPHAELNRLVGYEVPTLNDALEQHADPLWLLEVKTPAALDATLAIVGQYLGLRRLLLISFWHNVALALGQELGVETGLLVCHRPADGVAIEPPKSVQALVWNYEFVDEGALQEATARGLKNFVYGVEAQTEHQHCGELGFDGVITDHPEYLLG